VTRKSEFWSVHFTNKMMLLTNYRERPQIKFPCIVQEKLDGVRCLVRNGKAYSRSGREIKNIQSILDELGQLDVQLDGELWAENLTLAQITGMLNRKGQTRDLKMYVFDIKAPLPFSERIKILEKVQNEYTFSNVRFVKNYCCETEEEALALADSFIARGGEGAVFRNLNGLYINARSKCVQKYKSRFDEEFKVTGYSYTDTCLKLLKCVTACGSTFYVRCPADLTHTDLTNKMVTIRYLLKDPLTDIPREAVCTGVRCTF